MLGEYKLNRPTRRCAVADRPLREGEWYYSVMIESGDEDFIRQDIAVENWTEPPEGTVGYWKRRIPTETEKKLVLASPEVLVDLLRQMERFPARAKTRYLLALMLMRRRILRLGNPTPADTATMESASADEAMTEASQTDPGQESGQATGEMMSLIVAADGSEIVIPVCEISRSESDKLREELNAWLYVEVGSEESEVDEESAPDESAQNEPQNEEVDS